MSQDAKTDFRDRVATVDKEGKRIWVYPKKPSGRFTGARQLLGVILLAFLFIAPFIRVNGQQFLLLNILERKFIIFGLVFWPQDFYIFVLATITLVVFIVLFTVVFGRLWCGWACPQTIFMEIVFRKIEYWIEGDARKQIALNKAPWTSSKILKKTSKHIIFYAISFLIGNTFLAYLVGSDQLIKIITDPPSQHLAGLIAMILFSAVFYWVFAFFREQVCTLVCPYGRLQGVLLDQNSIVVSYDFKRGEPRGKLSRTESRGELGDCVDCNQCFEVCPTGIDIRNGTQLECINCTACIDACNKVMDKVKLPRGLIRYASYNNILNKQKLKINPRIIGYSLVFVVLITIVSSLLVLRKPIDTTILRTPGVMYQETEDSFITNLYNIKIVNKTFETKQIDIQLKSPNGRIKQVGGNLTVTENNMIQSAFFIEIPKAELRFVRTIVEVEVLAGDETVDVISTSFIGPNLWQK
jgi:cytochrome c oxidase accessory protein FixG